MQKIINFIEENLTRERLESIASSLINAYRSEDDFTLNSYAGAMGLKQEAGEGRRKKLFYGIIRRLHPDRLPVLINDFAEARRNGDEAALEMLKTILELKTVAAKARSERFAYEHTETWVMPEDFEPSGYSDEEAFEDDFSDSGFLNAVKSVIFGNLDYHVEPADLGQIDGELELVNCGLDELDGIEYCRNVRVLDISMNDISNIHDLQHLEQLEELYASGNTIRDIEALSGLSYLEIIDLSDNDIEDITPLMNMDSLKFVDLRNNPIRGRNVIKQLEAEDIVVIY